MEYMLFHYKMEEEEKVADITLVKEKGVAKEKELEQQYCKSN